MPHSDHTVGKPAAVIKRTLEISQQPVHLTVRDGQLLLLRKSEPAPRRPAQPDGLLAAVPCEDVGLVLVEHHGTTYTHAALTCLLDHDAAVVLCGRDHLPCGLLLPLGQHTELVWRLHEQLAVKKPLRKQLWSQLVQAKIRAQAHILPPGSRVRSKLLALARDVRSGDPTNVEAQAARLYWAAWLQDEAFHRDPDAGGLNALLNYGYAVLRAAVARAIVSAGLLPALGIHHSNRSNAFCLADDLVEPLRPLVDARVRALRRQFPPEITPETKAQLLPLLADPVVCAGQRGPLLVALHRYVASLVNCYGGAARRLEIPQPSPSPDASVGTEKEPSED